MQLLLIFKFPAYFQSVSSVRSKPCCNLRNRVCQFHLYRIKACLPCNFFCNSPCVSVPWLINDEGFLASGVWSWFDFGCCYSSFYRIIGVTDKTNTHIMKRSVLFNRSPMREDMLWQWYNLEIYNIFFEKLNEGFEYIMTIYWHQTKIATCCTHSGGWKIRT